jgi:heat shock protein HtpX
VHEDLIRSARRRIAVTAAAGVVVLALAATALVFPVAWVLGAASNPLGTDLGYGWGLVVWALWVSLLIGAVIAAVTFGWSLLHSEHRVLEFVRAWPGPRSTKAPPPRLPADALPKAEKLLTGVAIAAGVTTPPRVSVVIDDAPNCLTIGRRPESAWIVMTTGMLETLEKRELEAVLAYELGRVVELEVSLDTVVYAVTNQIFAIWAGAFDDLDEVAVLMAPLGLLLAPFALLSAVLRGSALRNRARLADGLAIRYCRNPVALVGALRRIVDDPNEVRRGDPANAHLWLEYPHTRASRWLLGTHRILPKRLRRLERAAGLG